MWRMKFHAEYGIESIEFLGFVQRLVFWKQTLFRKFVK